MADNSKETNIENVKEESTADQSIIQNIIKPNIAQDEKTQKILEPSTENQNMVEQEDANLTNAGGLSYWHSYNYNEGEGYCNENEFINYGLSERERQTLRDAGYKFTLSDEGEINGVLDNKGNKLSPKGIAEILKNK